MGQCYSAPCIVRVYQQPVTTMEPMKSTSDPMLSTSSRHQYKTPNNAFILPTQIFKHQPSTNYFSITPSPSLVRNEQSFGLRGQPYITASVPFSRFSRSSPQAVPGPLNNLIFTTTPRSTSSI